MKKSNLILKMTALPLLTGLALGGWQFANAAELSCVPITKDTVVSATGSVFENRSKKADFTKEVLKQARADALAIAKEKLKKVKPDMGDEPAACTGRCVDGGIMPPDIGDTKEKVFESIYDVGPLLDDSTPEQDAQWLRACIDSMMYRWSNRVTFAQAKATCEDNLKSMRAFARANPNNPRATWTLIVTVSLISDATFTRICENQQELPQSTGTQGTAGENR